MLKLLLSALLAVPAAAAQPVSEIRIGLFPNITHAQGVLAATQGDFEKAFAPAKVVIRTFNAGPSLVEALNAGDVHVGYVGPSPAVNGWLRTRGQGLKIVAGAAANGVAIVARPGSGIKTLADLKGRKVATPQLGNTQDVSARHYLTKVLGQPDASNVMPIPNADHAGLMLRGTVDASWSPEPWATRLVKDAGAVVIAEEAALWPKPGFPTTVVVASPDFLARSPESVERLLKVHAAWTEKLQKSPASHAGALAAGIQKLSGQPMAAEMVAAAIKRVRFTDDPLPAAIEVFAQRAFALGFLPEKPALAGLVDDRYLRAAKASGKAPARR